jgi:hypothetical protein
MKKGWFKWWNGLFKSDLWNIVMDQNLYQSPNETDRSPDEPAKMQIRVSFLKKPEPFVLLSLLLLGFVPLLPCMCGYLGKSAFSFTMPCAILAWYAFAMRGNTTRPRKIVVVIILVLATMAFAKNVGDVLWYGHDPIWPGISNKH